jgi:hypothetical protein
MLGQMSETAFSILTILIRIMRRYKGPEPTIAVSHGPFRANSGGENYPWVNPGLRSLGHFRPRIGRMTDEAKILPGDLL